MAVKFTPVGWMRWVERYAREARSAHLFAGYDEKGEPKELTRIDYAPATVSPPAWRTEARGPIVVATYPEIMWRFPERVQVDGCFVRDTNGDVLWVDEFDGLGERATHIHAVELSVEIDTRG